MILEATAAVPLPPLPMGWVVVILAALSAAVAMGKWMGSVGEFTKDAKGTFDTIKDKLEEVSTNLTILVDRSRTQTLDRGSRLRLTELGQRVAKEVDAESMMAQIAVDIAGRAFDKEPYDVQNLCFEYVRNEYKPSKADDDLLKECAFENGIDIQQVLDVLALVLRDMILAPPTQELDT